MFLQAGVGGLGAAVACMIRRNWAHQPEIWIVEPEAAPCLRESVAAGALTPVTGPDSIMGRLDCKEASLLAYDTLMRDADHFTTISDAEAQDAVTRAGELGYATTPSGAAGLAASNRAQVENALVILSEGAL